VRGGGPHRRLGRQRRPDRFRRGGDNIWCSERSKGISRGRGISRARWSGVRQSGVEKKLKGRRGGGGSDGVSSGRG
jgi:hypothetical protein